MKKAHFIIGIGKFLIYLRISVHVFAKYSLRPGMFGWSLIRFVVFLRRALILLLAFRHNKVVRVPNGYKLHLYLPAYPSPAFFYAIETKLLRTPPSATTVVFSMTKACTYKCKHCYQRRDGGPDLDEELLIRTARAVQESGVALYDIEGGEPFTRYERLLNLVQALDDRSEIWVNTTGAQVTPQMLDELKVAGMFGLMISIHSPDAEIHDSFSSVPGSFEVACETARMCASAGLAVDINCVLSEEEIRKGELARLMDLARSLGADYVQLIHPKPAGIWLGRTEDMQMDPNLIRDIRREHILYNSSSRIDYPSLAAQVFEEDESVLGCTCGGVDRFYVNATGEVQPCEFLNMSFGNVREEPFEVIFSRMKSFFAKPGTDWLCCTQAQAINEIYENNELTSTPLLRELSEQLARDCEKGKPTPLYERLGIYK